MKTLLAVLLLCGMVAAQTKFNVGNKVYVAHTNKVGVRAQPTVNSTLLGTQPNGRTGIVKAGPITGPDGDGRIRYQIDYAAGVDGWSVQDYLEKSAIQPPPPVTTKFVIGDRVVVIPDGPANPGGNVSVRATPAAAGVLLGVQVAGALGTVVGGPTLDPINQSTRYNINYDTGADGWSVELYLAKSSIPVPVTKSVTLTWNASVADATHTAAATYNLYRGGVRVGSVSGSTLTFTNTAVPSGTYTYTARAVDASGHESVDSNTVSVTIP